MPRPMKPRRGLLFSNFSSSQEGWEVQACSKSSSIEQVYPVQALQDGRDPHRERSPEVRGLHDKDRFEGCVFRCPCPLSASEVPAIPMEGSNLRVFVCSIWSSPSSLGLYEGAEASGRLPTEHGGSLCNLHRRPLADAPEQTGPADARQMLKESMVSARELAQLIGRMSAAILAIYPAPLHYRSLQVLKHQALAAAGYDGKITVSPEAKEDLLWWANNLRQWNGHTMARVGSQVAIETDASRAGWGAFCQGEATGGCWSREEQMLHINVLEMLAVFFALKAFLKKVEGYLS